MNATHFTERLPIELQLLIVCSRTELDTTTAKKLQTLIEAKPDWQQVLTGARYHGVMPLLHRHLSNLPSSVPAPILGELSNYARNNTVHNLMLAHALLSIVGKLREQSIEVVPYKGPVLASTVYGDVSLRSSKDLDVIVQPKDVSRAALSLVALGYAPTGRDPNGHFHVSFVHTETRVMLELHQGVLRRSVFWTPLTVIKLWSRLSKIPFLGKSVLTFSPEDTLLLLCLHGSNHAWQGLTWICDVAEYLRKHPGLEWKTFLQTAKQAQLLRMTLLGIKLAYDVLDAPLPASIVRVLEADAKLQALSWTIIKRMYKPNARGEATLTYRLQMQMRSGLWGLPLYGRAIKKRLAALSTS